MGHAPSGGAATRRHGRLHGEDELTTGIFFFIVFFGGGSVARLYMYKVYMYIWGGGGGRDTRGWMPVTMPVIVHPRRVIRLDIEGEEYQAGFFLPWRGKDGIAYYIQSNVS